MRIARAAALSAGSGSIALPVAPIHADGARDGATVNGHLHVESGIGKIRRVPAGISPRVQRRRIESASAGINQGIEGKIVAFNTESLPQKQIAGLNPLRIQAGDRP
ncbi:MULTISPECIES: hypothetical protein [Burkholderia cepacia complex]|uniref:hypothetical protein n=1 Tax=Burkholderia cepacia complex TaxID=87882 RepID=UPI0013DE6871|nr:MULTISPECIES: hypothetical protein [Burkholderia cepacia complex]